MRVVVPLDGTLVGEGICPPMAMATRARAGIAHALFGGIAERVIRRSPVPVLVVGSQAGVDAS